MAARNSTRARPRDLDRILGRFSDAIAVIAVVQRSLAYAEQAGDEESALLTAIELLNAAYNDLDEACRS